ncbi:MAG: HlyD family efflux transporter periplasmic adaptor subunit [Planctomycetota bacterium]
MAIAAQPHVQQSEREQRQQSEQQDQAKQEKRLARARLVQRLVENAGNLPDFMEDLIHTQASVVAGTEGAAFMIEGPDADGNPELRTLKHVRPDNVEDGIKRQAIMAFREIVTQCVKQDKDGALRVSAGSDESEAQFCLVTLLRQDDRAVAATAVITRCRDEGRALQRLSTMQLVAGYFDMFLLRRQSEQNKQVAKTHQDVLQFASVVATAEDFHASGVALCNELAARAGAARVALGWVKTFGGDKIQLKAISHTEEFDKKQELSVQLVAVMEECLDQDEFCQFDPAGGSTDNVTREAMKLSQMEGGNRVVSVPLRRREKLVGVMTMEFPPEKPTSPAESTALAVAAELLAPQLYDRFQNDRYLITKAGLSVRDNTKKVFGLRQHTLAKVIILAVLGLLLFLTLYKPMYRVAAPFEFVPEVRRVVDAPFNGQIVAIAEVDGRRLTEGDTVTAGQPIVMLDTREFEEELVVQQKAHQQAIQEALALRARMEEGPGVRAQQRAKMAEAEVAQARIAQIESKIEKSTLRSPVDGVILEVPGQQDLRERIGDVVQIGSPIVVVGDPSKLTIEARVADRDIADIGVGDPGTLATSSRPGRKIPLEVVDIIDAAAADPRAQTNAYTVVATVDPADIDPTWRSGGTGEVRIDVDNRSLAWQWTHRLTDWVRLKLWL